MFDFSQIPEYDMLQGNKLIYAGAENIHELVHLCHQQGIMWNPGYAASDVQIQHFADGIGKHIGLKLDKCISGIRYRFVYIDPTTPGIRHFYSSQESQISSADVLAMLG